MTYAKFGPISSGTMRPEDLIPAFAGELDWLTSKGRNERSKECAALLAEANEIGEDGKPDYESEEANYVLEALFEALDEFAPAYGYFGAHPGDGADYGFWLYEDFQQNFRDDGGLEVSDTSEVPADYTGEVLHVNDHGNCTLYFAKNGELTEIWAVV